MARIHAITAAAGVIYAALLAPAAPAATVAAPAVKMTLTRVGHFRYRRIAVPQVVVTNHAPLLLDYRVRANHMAALQLHWPGLRFPSLKTIKSTAAASGSQANAHIAPLTPTPEEITKLARPGLPLFIRYALTRAKFALYTSTNGVRFSYVTSIPRSAFPQGQPSTFLAPVAWIAPASSAAHKPRPAGKHAWKVHISALHIRTGAPRLPASLLQNFSQRRTLHDTLDALFRDSFPKTVRLLGPFAQNPNIPPIPRHSGFKKTFALTTGRGGWKTVSGSGTAGSHMVQVSALLKAQGPNLIYFAACTVVLPRARREELLFSGVTGLTVYVNGKEVAKPPDANRVTPDAHRVLVSMPAGKNRIIVRLNSKNQPRTAFMLRAVRGSRRYQLALRQRLVLAFPDNQRSAVKLRLQISRFWRSAGYLPQAAEALGVALKSPAAGHRRKNAMLLQQAAIDEQLGETRRVAAIVTTLSRWAQTRGRGVSAQLALANVWGILKNRVRQRAVLRAISLNKAMPPFARYACGLQLASDDWQAGRKGQVPAKLRTLADIFPTNNDLHAALLLEAFVRAVRAHKWPAAQIHAHLAALGSLKTMSKYQLMRLAGVTSDWHDTIDNLAILHELASRPAGKSYINWNVAHALALAAAGQYQAAARELATIFQWAQTPAIPTPYTRQSVNAWRLADLQRSLAASSRAPVIAAAGARLKPLPLARLLIYAPRKMHTVLRGLSTLASSLLSHGHGRAARAVVGVMFAYFPDQPQRLNNRLVDSFANYAMRKYRHPNEILAINRSGQDLNLAGPGNGRAQWLNYYATNAGFWAAIGSQRFRYNIQQLKLSLCWTLNRGLQTSTLVELGVLYRVEGRIHAAMLCLRLAAGMVHPGIWHYRQIRAETAHARGLMALTRPIVGASMAVTRTLASARMALANKSTPRALRDYHRLMVRHGAAPMYVGRHLWLPLRSVLVRRITAHGPVLVRAWRRRYARRAERALRRAIQRDSARAISRVVLNFPLTPAAPRASAALAALYLRRGQPQLALDVCNSLLKIQPALSPATLPLALRAAASANDAAAYARFTAMAARTPGVTAAPPLPAGPGAGARLAKRQPASGGQPGFARQFPFPMAWRDAQRAWRPRFAAAVVAHPFLYHNIVFLSTVSRVFAFSAGTGRPLWQASSGSPGIGPQPGPPVPAVFSPQRRGPSPANNVPPVPALPETWIATKRGRIFIRQSVSGVDALQCRNAADGRLIWTSRATGVLKGMHAISSPTVAGKCVVAIFGGGARQCVAAFWASTGRLLWTARLVPPGGALAGVYARVAVPEDGAPPTYRAGNLYIATNGGTVEDIDAATGAWRWARGYSRTVLGRRNNLPEPAAVMRRATSRIFATRHHLFIAPCDALKIICLSRKNGKLVWQRATNSARELATMERINGHRALLLQGNSLRLLAARDGRTLWRWQPRGQVSAAGHAGGKKRSLVLRDQGPTLGEASMSPKQIAVTTRLGLYLVNPRTGKTTRFRPWKTLITMPVGRGKLHRDQGRHDTYFAGAAPGNILSTPDGNLFAVGNGMLAKISATGQSPPVRCTALPPADGLASRLGPALLPTGKPGNPMVALWRIGAGPVEQLLKLNNASPKTWLARFRRLIICFHADTGLIVWQKSCPPASHCVRHGNVLAILGPYSLSLRDARTGTLLWTRNHQGTPALVAAGNATILIHPNGGHFSVFSNRSARLVRHWQVVKAQWRYVSGATVYQSHLFAVIRNNQSVNVREYALPNGNLLRKIDIGYKPAGATYGMHLTRFKNWWIIAGGHQTVAFNLATQRATHWSRSMANYLSVEDGRLVRFYVRKSFNTHWYAAVMNAQTGQTFFHEAVSGPASNYYDQFRRYAPGIIGGVLVHRLPGNAHAIVGQNPMTGQTLWRTTVPPPQDGWCRQVYRLPGHMVYCFSHISGRYSYVIINAHGKITAQGFFPGWPVKAIPAPPVVGNNILFASTAGLYCLAPVPPGALAAAKPARGPAADMVRFDRRLTNKALPIYPAAGRNKTAAAAPGPVHANSAVKKPGTPAAPGAWPWTARFGGVNHVSGAGPSTAAALARRSGNIRVSYTPGGLNLTVKFNGALFPASMHGLGPRMGSCIVVGIAARRNGGRERHPMIMAFWLSNGRWRMMTLRRAFAKVRVRRAGPGGRGLAYRLHATLRGGRLRLTVPWMPLLNQLARPDWLNQVRMNAALVVQSSRHAGALEWGHGLIHGVDSHLWPLLQFASRK